MKKSVITIQSFVIITIIVYALLAPIFFQMDNAFGGETYFVVDEKNNESDKKTMTSNTQKKVETKECKSPCPSSAEMCIEIYA
jgi:uncharacterized protein YxeA